jgi:hypothetical protein
MGDRDRLPPLKPQFLDFCRTLSITELPEKNPDNMAGGNK